MGIGREILRDIGELILGNSKEAGQFLDAIETVADNVTNSVKKMFSHKSSSSDDDYEFPYIESKNDTNPLDELYDKYKDEPPENIVDTLYNNDNKFSNEEFNLLYGILTEERFLSDDEIQVMRFRNENTFDLLFYFYDTANSEGIRKILKNVIIQSRNLQESDFRNAYINGFKEIIVSNLKKSENLITPDAFNNCLLTLNDYNLEEKEIDYLKHQILKELKIKTKRTCLLLATSLGFFGGHRFYVHKRWSALAYILLTCFTLACFIQLIPTNNVITISSFSLITLLILIDIIKILSGKFKDKNGINIIFWKK